MLIREKMRPLMFGWDDITSAVSSVSDTVSNITGDIADATGAVSGSLTTTSPAPKAAQVIPMSPQVATTVAKAGLSGAALLGIGAAAYFLLK